MAVRALSSAGADKSLIDGKVVAIGKDQKVVQELLGVTVALHHAKPSLMGIIEALKANMNYSRSVLLCCGLNIADCLFRQRSPISRMP